MNWREKSQFKRTSRTGPAAPNPHPTQRKSIAAIAPAARNPTQRKSIDAAPRAPPFRRPVTPAPRASLSKAALNYSVYISDCAVWDEAEESRTGRVWDCGPYSITKQKRVMGEEVSLQKPIERSREYSCLGRVRALEEGA